MFSRIHHYSHSLTDGFRKALIAYLSKLSIQTYITSLLKTLPPCLYLRNSLMVTLLVFPLSGFYI